MQAAQNVLDDYDATINCLKHVAGSLKLCENPRLRIQEYRRINFLNHRNFIKENPNYRTEGMHDLRGLNAEKITGTEADDLAMEKQQQFDAGDMTQIIMGMLGGVELDECEKQKFQELTFRCLFSILLVVVVLWNLEMPTARELMRELPFCN